MRRIITVILLFLIGLALVVFLVSNRQEVLLSMDPFSEEAPALALGPMPLSYVLLIPLFIGFALGGFGAWLSGGRTRRALRERKREVRRLREELKEARGVTAPRDDGVLVPVEAQPGPTPTSLPALRA